MQDDLTYNHTQNDAATSLWREGGKFYAKQNTII